MDEEALKYAFELFKKDGYNGSIEEYQGLIKQDEKAFEYSYDLFKKDGYNGKSNEFKTLIGLTDASQTNQPTQEATDPLKKKVSTNTTSVSELSELGSSQQKEVGVSEQPTSNNQPPKFRIPTEQDDLEMQRKGFVAPPSESFVPREKIFESNTITIKEDFNQTKSDNVFDLESNVPKEVIEQPTENIESTKFRIPTEQDDLQVLGISKVDRDYENKEIEEAIIQNDLLLQDPYLYYSGYNTSSNNQNEKDSFIPENYGEENLKELGINIEDFDGFLNKKGYKNDFRSREEAGVFEQSLSSVEGRNAGNADFALAKEIEQERLLNLYLSERDKRLNLSIELGIKKENINKTDVFTEKTPLPTIGSTEFDQEKIREKKKELFPILSLKREEKLAKETETYKEYKNGEDGIGFLIEKSLESAGKMLTKRADGFSSSIAQTIGLSDLSLNIRSNITENDYIWESPRNVVNASGKKTNFNGTEYLVDDQGQVYDTELKLRVTDLIDPFQYKELVKQAKDKGEDDYIFSPQGAMIETSGVIADLGFQILLTRGAGATVSGVSTAAKLNQAFNIGNKAFQVSAKTEMLTGSFIAQSTLGYASGLEDTYTLAKAQGLNDREAESIAQEAANNMAVLYGLTSFISPQTKATQAIFGSTLRKDLIKKGLENYTKKGLTGFKEFFKKETIEVGKKAVLFLEEGTKEAVQENIQQISEKRFVNTRINERLGSEAAPTETTKDEVITTTVLSLVAGGLMPLMKRPNWTKNNASEHLKILATLSNGNADIDTITAKLVSEGDYTQKDVNDLKKDINVFKKHINTLPKKTKPKNALEIMRKLEELDVLQSEKKSVNAVFHEEINSKIKIVTDDINKLYNVIPEAKTTIKSVDGETVLSDNNSLYEKISDDDFIESVAIGEIEIEIKNNQEASDLLNQRVNEFKEEQKAPALRTAEAISENIEDLGDVMGGGAVSITEGGSKLVLTQKGDNIKVESISTPKAQRGQGSARALMTKLTDEADNQGKAVELNVVPLTEDTSAEQLVTFYESLGFVKEEDFDLEGGVMIRQPQKSSVTETNENIETEDAPVNLTEETTPQQAAIDRVAETNDTYFDELENEEDSISRLEGEIDPNKDRNAEIERIAEEHTESYKAYLEENNELDKLEDTEFVQTFKDNAVKALSNPNTVEDNQTQTQEDGVRVDENGNPITEEEFLLEQDKVKPNEIANKQTIIIKTRPKSKSEDPEVLSGVKAIAAEKSIERIIDNGVKKGQTLEEIRDRVFNKYTFSQYGQDVVDFIKGRIDGTINEDFSKFRKPNEAAPKADTTPNADVRPATEPSQQQGQDNAVQPTVEPTGNTAEVTQKPIVRQSFGNEVLDVELKNGEVVVTNSFNNDKKVSRKNKKAAVKEYIAQNTFDNQQYTETESSDPSVNSRQISDESTNPSEVALQIQVQEQAEQDGTVSTDQVSNEAKQNAIAETFKNFRFKKVDLADGTKGYEVVDLSQGYKGGQKQTATMGTIIEEAQRALDSNTSQETDAMSVQATGFDGSDGVVSEDDIRDFVNDFTSGTDYLNQVKKEQTTESSEVQSLKEKFTELTGLEATSDNIDAVSNSSNNQQTQQEETKQAPQEDDSSFLIEDDGLPFQTNDPNKIDTDQTLSKEELTEQIQQLIPTGLAEDVVVLDSDGIDAKLAEIGVDKAQTQSASNNGVTITPNGFVHNEIVYLNVDKVKPDTAVHEFGHLWNSYMKDNHKEVFDRGIKLMEGSQYLADVENNEAYDHLSPEGKLEEALAQAIGDKGAKILEENKKKSFANWFNVLFKRIANGLRLSNIQPTRLANLNLKQFTDLAAAEILAGKNITGRDTKAIKDARKRKDVVPNTSIQSVIQKEEAVNAAKQKVVDTYERKQKTEDGVKKALQDYIDESLSAAQATEAKKPELKRLVDIVANAKTDTNYLRAIEKIDSIIDKLDDKYNTSKTEAQNVRNEAKKAADEKSYFEKEFKKIAKKYLTTVIKNKFLSDITFNDINKINSLLDRPITANNAASFLKEIDNIAVNLETKYNERKARNEQKRREAQEKIRDKKADIKEVQKIVLAYINDAIDNNFMGNATPSETKRLIRKAKFEGRKTGTDAQKRAALQKVVDEVIDIDLGVKNKGLRKKFLKELTTGRSKKQSGRLKVGTVDYFSTETIMEAIENYINGNVDFLNPKEKNTSNSNAISTEAELLSKKEKDINDIIEILDERADSILYEESVNEKGETVLTPKKTITDEESQVLNSLYVAKAFLNSQIKGNKYANRLLNNAVSYITELKSEGRSILKAKKEADKAKLDEEREQAIQATDVKNAREDERFNRPLSNIRDNVSKSQSELRKVRGFIRKYSNSLYRNFFSIAEDLKRSGSNKTILEGSDRVLKQYDLAENLRDLTILSWEKEVTDIKKDVFGSITDSRFNFIKKAADFLSRSKIKRAKSDWALSEQFDVDRDYGDGTTDIYRGSAATLLDVLLKAKDPQNLSKLAKQGFDAKAILQIETLLSDEVKEYGERILEFYQDKYQAVNEVYKKMFYRDMPFSEFYSGKLNVDNDNENQNPSQDLLGGMLSSGSVHSGSTKARKANNYAIQPQPVDVSLSQYINDMSRFIAYAEVDKRFNNIFNNVDFEKVVLLNNGIEGGVMIKYLRDFQRTEIYEDGKRGAFDRVVNQITGNLTKFTLSAKLFNLPIQMMSATSGQSSLPNNLSPTEWVDAHKNIISEAAYVFKNSKLLQLRYSGEQMVKVLSSVDTNRQLQDFNVPLVNDRTKFVFDIMGEVYNQANDLGMSFIKGGDAFGVLGVIPVFTANKNRIRKENPNLTDQEVIDEAMLIFESIANEIQQPQTKGGKTAVQRDTYARLLVSFGSTVILDMRNTSLRYKDIKRHIKSKAANNQTLGDVMRKLNFDVDEYKNVKPSNTLSKDIRGFINYGFSQPLFYATWGVIKVTGSIAAVGGAIQVLGALIDDEDDEEQLKQFSDEDKDLARVALTGQILDDAILGNAFKYYLDKEILQKEFTFGGIGNVFVISETQKLQKYYERAQNAKTEATKQKYIKLLHTQMAGMGLGLAKHGMLIALFNKEINSNQSYGFTAGEKARIYAGTSFFAIDKVREERTGVALKTILEDSISDDDNNGEVTRGVKSTRANRPTR
jgi:predicted GNAT family acetyltransferase